MGEILNAYCDGGVLGKNPSPLGGMWAWCLVKGKKIVQQDSGFIEPHDVEVETVSNNLTELLAAVRCLTSLPPDWNGTLHTDSVVTLYRLTTGRKFNGIPNWLRLKCLDIRRNRKYEVRLVAGHPTQQELLEGLARRNGLPVSPWNVWADKRCGEIGKLFREGCLGF